jgi:acyl carrier protein
MQLTADHLIAFIKGTLQIESDIDAQSRLFSTGELDSMSMMQLIDFIETSAGIDVRPDDVTLENFDSIENILRFVSDKA